jgi:hypothetical protein
VRRGFLVVAALLVIATAVVVGVARRDNGLSKAEVLRYQDDILELVQEWGRIEVQGMRPAIADLRTEGEGIPAETIAGEARAWQAGLGRIRSDLREVDAPEGLEAVAARFDSAMDPYLEAAATFEQAASAADAGERERLIGEGIEQVRRGARRYNEASMLFQAARRRVGLPTTPDFPDHPAE